MTKLLRYGVVSGLVFIFLAAKAVSAANPPAGDRLKLVTQFSYLPVVPVLVRVEVLNAGGQCDRDLWDAEATLDADGGVTLSTNKVTLRNGMGSALVTFAGGGDFTLTATVGNLSTNRSLNTATNTSQTTIGGTLPGGSTTWSGVVRVTNTVIVPVGHILTIQSNTLVIINGVASGTAGAGLIINGAIQSSGTEAHPVAITCAEAALRWGQIRHDNAQPSTYRHTSITRAGRAPGEGHTGQAPIFRPSNSTVTFENCSLTDHADASGAPGKIGFGLNSDLTFRDCLLSRARTGPEIQGTAILCTNTWFIDMRGPDDSDGIYLHDQQAGQQIKLSGCVFAGGDDDGIDTLGAVVTVENCIIRDWASLVEDAKGISVFDGAVAVRGSLITDCTVGIAAKTGSGTSVRVTLNNSTLTGNLTNVLAQFKANAPGPVVDYRITNCVLWGGDAVQSDFAPTNFTIVYSDISEPWSGAGNINSDPLFLAAAAHNFHLQAGSPCRNAGDPASPLDPDNSRADIGAFPFEAAGANGLFVSLTAPANGSVFTAPTNILLDVSASSTTGSVTKVEFYQSSTKLGEDSSNPYSLTWSNVSPGSYTLRAVATDNGGLMVTSSPVNITVANAQGPTTNVLLPLGSIWKYLDNGSDQGTNWSQRLFDDSAWPSGPAQLGYGDGDEATLVGYGPNGADKYPTTYFRRAFNVSNPAQVQSLNVNLLRDDGAVLYINGVELYRVAMAPGPVGYRDYSTSASEYNFEFSNVPAPMLLAGNNVIAVEVHQGNGGSTDLSFELELSAVVIAPTNQSPLVNLTAPADNTTLAAPASLTLTANATDLDGTVTNVAFHANGVKLADDTGAPYSYPWNGVAAGTYALTAVATDATGLSSTSSVVTLTVSTNTAAPLVAGKSPAPGALTNLTQLTVTFSKNVLGVDAGDLRVNGTPAAAVSGSGSNFTFTFPQPPYGTVSITWSNPNGITDVFTPPAGFNTNSSGANWQYTLLDIVPPAVATLDPVPGSTVAALTSISITFSEVVTGVNAADLRVNSLPVGSLTGSGAGPYVFAFAQPIVGGVSVSWAANHGIRDLANNPFAGGSWGYTLDTNSTGLVISEIMYHPSSENILEEYIELYNKGAAPVNLGGWRFSGGVQFTFPTLSIPAGGYLVVAADTNTFKAKYPAVANVVGNWTGFLNNSAESIDLDDASGRRVDSVTYADEGDWAIRRRGPSDLNHRGWKWFAEHDGLGKSLELINPSLSNNSGQNWAASHDNEGTPGRVNSVFASNVAPLILEATHFPIVPTSTDPLLFTARILDETAGSVAVTLHYRVDAASPPPFVPATMHDDGLNGDAAAGDGIYSARLLAQLNNAVIEFYIGAVDLQGNTRAWPAPVLGAVTDGFGPTGQVANALLQVDNTAYNPTNNQPLYKVIMTEAERVELQGIPCSGDQNTDAEMNTTFISIDTSGVQARYLTGLRNRGHGSRCASPPNYRVGFRSDDKWKGVTALNLNTVNSYIQHLGSVVARKAGAAGANSLAVQVRVNNQNRASSGAPMFGSYAANETLNSDWAETHYPDDPNGNVYRVIRDLAPPDFSYRGEAAASYQNTWFKESNASENDWTDLVGMLRVAGINNLTPFTTENARQVIHVEQWLKHLAVMNIFGNAESGLNTGFNDDYYMYRGVTDPRFILACHDLDSILGVGSLAANSSIFTATANAGSGQAMDRFMNWPDFQPIYYRTLQELMNTTFAQAEFDALVDQTLAGYVDVGAINNIKSWMSQRRASVLSQIPAFSITNPPVATVTGAPRSPTPLTAATLTVGGTGVTAYRVSVNGGAFGAETSIATVISLGGLVNGTNSVSVIGKDTNNVWQATSNATVRSWVVNTAWPAARLNEILARNDSALNYFGTFPDLIELFNEGGASVDLSGLRLTDDPGSPGKFTFPAGTPLLAAGARLVVYANNPDATPGLHVGFNLDANGEGVYLFDRATNGNRLLDSAVFGMQLPNLSIGRVAGGDWVLTQPTFGATNVAQPLGNQRSLKLNEWLASGLNPYPEDFIELFNPVPLPVALGGLYLTDQPIGAPTRSPIAPLSFIASNGFAVFTADGNSGAAHANFHLSIDQGEIGLIAADRTVIDCVLYGPQNTDISSGRCPDGAIAQKALVAPTPGAPNACPFVPPPPQMVSFTTISNVWRYDQSGTNLGTAWIAPAYNDSAWPSGPGLFGFDSATLPEPFRTGFTLSTTKTTFYFRTTFNMPSNLNVSALQIRHIIDDGVIVYLNGNEVHRTNMPAGPVTATTLASVTVDNAIYQGPFGLALTNVVPGLNSLAAEVHQALNTSGDVAFGLELTGVIATNSPAAAGVVINEVLANNTTLEEPDGSRPDWLEIYNPSQSAVDLGGMSLTDDTLVPRRWVLPAGSLVPALGFFKARLDPDLPASATNAGFGLKANGGAVYLFNRLADGGTLASAVSYGLQAADFSIGRVPNGSANWMLTIPTLGGANLAASLGDPLQLKVNEWMADPAAGEDWFEIFNPNAQPVDISRFWLSDDVVLRQNTQLPALSFIGAGPNGYLKFDADNLVTSGPDHVGFKLGALGEALALSTTNGTLINGVSFGPQELGVSEGWLLDGSSNRVRFPTTPTPGKPNFLPLTTVVINEVLTHTDPPLEDAVEIHNPTGDDVEISNWYLSDSPDNLLKFRIPGNTVVRAGGFVVLYEYQFNYDNPDVPFSFSSAKGDEIFLSQASAAGSLTGYRAFAEFGASENGVSFGRHPTSVGIDFTAMSARTFGADNPATTNQFHLGTGLTNAYPSVGPIVFNEIMYHPPGTNDVLEFLELHNIVGSPVPLRDPANPNNTWRLRKGVDFDFPTNLTIPAGGFLVVVGFDPQLDPVALATFQAAYGTNMTLVGPYTGKLDNSGETLELQKPDAPQTAPGPDYGFVPHIVVDRVNYRDLPPWAISPDGFGDSLKRIGDSLYGNDPANWGGGTPTPGAANFTGGATNTPPVLGAIGNKTVNELTLLSFTATATDAGAPPQSLTFSLDAGAPAGATITPGGAFTWAPDETRGPGVYPVTVRVTDNGSPVLSDFETISITVNDVNSPPSLNPIGNKAVNEGSLVTFTALAVDSDSPAQTLTYTLEAGAPPAASLNPTNGVFSWTTGEADGPGVYPVTVRVSDNGSPPANDFETITITINEANTAPVLAAPGNRTVNELATLIVTNTATDADLPPQTLTFALVSAPAGVAMDATTGRLTWMPDESQGPVTNTIVFSVTDSGSPGLSATQSCTVVVNEVNVAPVLANIGNLSATAGTVLAFTASASDADLPAQALTYSLDNGAPAGASIHPTSGAFSWTPPAQGASNYTVTVRVTDGTSLDDFETITITVNAAPNRVTLLNFTSLWRYLDNGTNLGTAWKETAFNDSAWPSGAGVLYNEASTIPEPKNTLLSLTDPMGGRVTNYYFRTRFTLPANPAGVALTVSNLLDDGAIFYLNGAEAGRLNMPAGPVTSTTFAAASWEATNYVVTNLTASSLVAGDNVLAVEVHQQSATSSDVVFGLSLTALVPAQMPLAITAQPASTAVTAGTPAQFSVSTTGSYPLYQWFKNGLPIAGANSATYAMASAQSADAGTYRVVVSNLVNAVTSSNAVLTVNPPPNSPPVLAAIGNKTANEGAMLSFTATASDPEAPPQTLTFMLDAGAPSGASITAGGVFTWMPDESQGGTTNTVTIRVRDSGSPVLEDFETITLIANEVNAPPVLPAITNKTVTAGALLTFSAAASDSDLPVQTLAYTLDPGAPAGAAIHASSGIFTWTPPAGSATSTNPVTVRVTDNGVPPAVNTKSFSITVVGAPRIVSIAVSPAGAVTLQWESHPGKTYRVRSSPDLANWTTLGSDVIASGPLSSATDTVGGNQRRFYRVLLTN